MSNNQFLRVYGDTDFITGLRAIAATMVVVIHSGAFMGWGPLGSAITGAGKYGVDIFFVISGFTIAKTFTESSNYRSYLIRRLMRILPLYYLLITFTLFITAIGLIAPSYWMLRFGAEADLYNWIFHLSLLSYFDYRVANSILGVEWSIPIEIFWYVTLPAMLFISRTLKGTIAAIVALVILSAIFSYISKKYLGTSLPIKWTPVSYGHLFFLGAWSYYFRSRALESYKKHAKTFISVAVVTVPISIFFEFDGRGELLALSTAILIAFLQPNKFGMLCQALTARPMLFLGSISYSIYLIHPLVIKALLGVGIISETSSLSGFVLIYCITVTISSITYVLIEKTTNKLGRNLSLKMS